MEDDFEPWLGYLVPKKYVELIVNALPQTTQVLGEDLAGIYCIAIARSRVHEIRRKLQGKTGILPFKGGLPHFGMSCCMEESKWKGQGLREYLQEVKISARARRLSI